MQTPNTSRSMAEGIAEFAAGLTLDDVPAAVRARAKLQILDALGTGIASHAYPFAGKALAGIYALAKAIVPTVIIGLIAWRQIDNAAHLGGFLTGAIIGLACFFPSEGKLPLPSSSLTSRLDRVSQYSIGCAACWALISLVK